ncbi:MAG: hypothetical protein WKF40_05355 [Thermoleophilaceae bacterium]
MAAEQVGYLDPGFFVYSDETDFCKRLHDAGWRILFVPGARAVHHDQLSTDTRAARRRIVEFHRNRDRYMAKHHGPPRALRGSCPGGLVLRGAGGGRGGRARPRSPPLRAARAPGAVAGARRGDPRGRRRIQQCSIDPTSLSGQ